MNDIKIKEIKSKSLDSLNNKYRYFLKEKRNKLLIFNKSNAKTEKNFTNNTALNLSKLNIMKDIIKYF